MSGPVSAPGSGSGAWSLDDIGDQSGRTVVVTGTTVGGIGHVTALELARRGARVVLAGRTEDKLVAAQEAITAEVPSADLVRLRVDLASLTSVREAASRAADLGPIHVLVNNAGVMATPRRRTVDGLDLQLATNHVGPFLLTGLLLPQLVASAAGRAGRAGTAGTAATVGRVVAVSSLAHRMARRAPLGDPHRAERLTSRWGVYGRSKLANLLVTHELDRRARAAGLPLTALAAHPGFAGTHLAANGLGGSARGVASILDATVRAISQPVSAGAWPTLMAATADLPGGTVCGPSGLGELAGAPQVVTVSALARDASAARRLWELSEETTGIRYP